MTVLPTRERRKRERELKQRNNTMEDRPVQHLRDAEFWRRKQGTEIACDLCYRACELKDGEEGWCQYRSNQGGTMELLAHGVVSYLRLMMMGHYGNPFSTWKPGVLSLQIGATSCTAHCTFCWAKDIAWRPEKLPWLNDRPWKRPSAVFPWANKRTMLMPENIVSIAGQWEAKVIEFTANEPTLSWEYTFDTATLAKRAGLDVVLHTNGFATLEATRRLTPVVDAVLFGIKGSAAPAFYERWMGSPGAVPTVLQSAKVWRDAGVYLVVGDVIAPPHMQSDQAAEDAQRELCTWIARELGPLTVVALWPMIVPGKIRTEARAERHGLLLPSSERGAGYEHYLERIRRAEEIAHAAGLHYAHAWSSVLNTTCSPWLHGDDVITCHSCGGVVLRFPVCPEPQCGMGQHVEHEQHVTDGRCDHCGTEVPIVSVP